MNRRDRKKAHLEHVQPVEAQTHSKPHNARGGEGAEHKPNHVYVRGGVEVTIPKEVAEKRDASEENRDTREQRRYVVEVWGLVAVIAYAGLTAGLVWISHRQLDASQDASKVDQRAWVGPKTFAILNLPLEANKPIQIGLDYWNYGKTPALNVSGVAMPDLIASTSKVNFANWKDPKDTDRGALFPGGTNHIVREFQGIPDPVFAEFMEGKSILYIAGNLGYDDIFGFHHWTHFCLRYSVPDKGFAYCDTFNEVDPEHR